MNNDWINDIDQDLDDRLWIGTNGGISSWEVLSGPSTQQPTRQSLVPSQPLYICGDCHQLQCDEVVPDPPDVTATDNCDTDLPVTFAESSQPGNCPDSGVMSCVRRATPYRVRCFYQRCSAYLR